MPRAKPTAPIVIERFGLRKGQRLGDKYEVMGLLGRGWEGEVYLIKEVSTGIERAAKFFFPHRNPRGRAAAAYAKKLHKLRHCPILVQYHTQERLWYHGIPISFLVSDYVEGEQLSEFCRRQPGARLPPFEALHLLYALAIGVEKIHALGEYHGDLHDENIIVQRYGIGFDVKLLDMYHRGAPRPENIHDDVCDLVRLFYDAVGGARHYARQPRQVKEICCGLQRSRILRKFRNAGQLRQHLEALQWD